MKKPFTFTISSNSVKSLELYMQACEFISVDHIYTELNLAEIAQVVRAIRYAYEDKVRNTPLGAGPDVDIDQLELMKEYFQNMVYLTNEMIRDTLSYRRWLSKSSENKQGEDRPQPENGNFQKEYRISSQ